MSRNQERIEGSYSIVSTDRPEWATGECTLEAVRIVWSAGCSVALAVGVWDNEKEESLIISGPKHALIAAQLAAVYNQDAYITVGDGKATLMGRDVNGYAEVNVFTRQVERTIEPGYTLLADGREIVFAG